MKRRIPSWLAGASFVLLAGCTVGPDYHAPTAALPARWTPPAPQDSARQPSRIVQGDFDTRWWETFQDPELSALVARVASTNLDLKAASVRLLQARATRQVVDADRLPSLQGELGYQHARSSQHGLLDIAGLDGKHDYNLWQYGVDASWELDLWGRVRREAEAADANVAATADLRDAVALELLAETATRYVRLRGVQANEAILRQSLDIARDILRLSEIRVKDGVATKLEVAEARAQMHRIEARLPQLENERVRLVNALSFLVAEPPRALEGELAAKPLPPVPADIPVGLPGELVTRRPDVRAAEARLHAATAQIGVAIGDFYPRITLSAGLNLQAMRFGDLDSWGSRAFGVGPAISVPIFEGGRLKGQLALRNAQQQEAMIAWQRVVLQAWHEVDDAMSAFSTGQEAHDRLVSTERESRLALQVARQQYLGGAVDFLNVLSAQRDLIDAQQALVSSSTDVSVSLVRLYKALGGGWEATSDMTQRGPATATAGATALTGETTVAAAQASR